MSKDNNTIQNDDKSSIINTPQNSENDSLVNKENTETIKTIDNKPNVPNINIKTVIDNKSQEIIPNIREDMVSKATDFLLARPVQNTTIDRKVNFLRQKGLTDQEIQISLQRAALYSNNNDNSYVQNSLSIPLYNNFSNNSGAVQTSYKSQSWFRLIFGPIVIAATIVYIGNNLYKKYIEKWLFGTNKSPVEERLEAVEFSMQRCLALLEEKNSMFELSDTFTDRQKELDQIRTELKSIKSLLLNRSQFPPAPASSSIPQWQLAKNIKSQGEQQNKVNGTDTLNSLQNNMIKNLVYGPHVTGVVDVANGTNHVPKYDGTSSSSSSGQNTINSNEVIIQTNGDK